MSQELKPSSFFCTIYDFFPQDLQLLKRRTSLASDILPEEIFLDTFDPKERARKIEREMNEQAKIVQELKYE